MAMGKRTEREQSHVSPSQTAANEAPDAPMTENQRERLRVLSGEVGTDSEPDLTRAQADARIQELQMELDLSPRTRQVETVPKPLVEEPTNINLASREELRLVEGIGSRRADEIVTWREAKGPFDAVEDLQHLPEFDGQVVLELRNKLCV